MQIEIKLDESVMIHETIFVDIVMDNNTKNDITIFDPEFTSKGLSFELTNTDSGSVRTYQLNTAAAQSDPMYEPTRLAEKMMTIKPGVPLKKRILLMAWTGELAAGNYSATALVTSEEKTFKSLPVTFKVLAANHLNPYLLPPVSGLITDWYTVFALNLPDGGLNLYLHGSILDGYVKSQGCQAVTKLDHPVFPVLSTAINTGLTQGHWVMWPSGSKLIYTYKNIQEASADNSIRQLDMGASDFQLFAPISMKMAMEDPPGTGSAFLLETDKDQQGSLIMVEIDPSPEKKARILKLADLPHTQADWNLVTYLSNGDHVVHWITSDNKDLSFHSYIRPAAGKPSLKLNQHLLSGRLITADAQIKDDDTLTGACLFQPDGSSGNPKSTLFFWEIDSKGNFKAEDTQPIDWPEDMLLETSKLRVSRSGEIHLLMGNDKGEWFYCKRKESLNRLNFVHLGARGLDLLITAMDIPVIRFASPVGFHYQYLSGKVYDSW